MASTRNINTPGNYVLEQRQYKQNEQYNLYKNSQYGEASSTKYAGLGLLPGQLPVDKLSYNPIDIEGLLFGIGSTNLVNPIAPIIPQLKTLETANIYVKQQNIMPLPLVIERNRPFPCP